MDTAEIVGSGSTTVDGTVSHLISRAATRKRFTAASSSMPDALRTHTLVWVQNVHERAGNGIGVHTCEVFSRQQNDFLTGVYADRAVGGRYTEFPKHVVDVLASQNRPCLSRSWRGLRADRHRCWSCCCGFNLDGALVLAARGVGGRVTRRWRLARPEAALARVSDGGTAPQSPRRAR